MGYLTLDRTSRTVAGGETVRGQEVRRVGRRGRGQCKWGESRKLVGDMAVGRVVEEKEVTKHVEVSRKAVLRASAPAQRKNKESPLSSEAIFHKVRIFLGC